ncbi:ABC transporter substrate-binding protein [Virgibacillus siamensis]|uniref:ABC transporter substrate-binding protein n=1 Tax=Virgibacillus siamensis TaxID=480071 RepID=UPI000986660C|nr:extracellular solute-binding protein [Virgibacillus siamensis]
MKKVWSLIICFCVVTGLLLTGCQSNSSDATDGSDGKEGDVTLTLWNNISAGRTYFPILIEKFEEKNPNININLKNLSVESSQAQYQAAISDNNLPDMFTTSSYSISQLVDLDLVHSLNSIFPKKAQKQYTDGVFAPGNTMVGDKIYLFPIYKGGAYMMYYNKDVLNKLGIEKIPETWDELEEAGKKVYEKSDGKTYGLLFGGKSEWLVNAVTQMMARGISPVSGLDYKTGKYNYSTEGHIETIKYFKDLFDNNVLSPVSLETNSTKVRALFASGQSAFLFDGNWSGLLMHKNGFDNFGVAPLPVKSNGGHPYGEFGLGSGDGMYVSKNTEHWPEVKRFLKFLRENIYGEAIKVGEATVAKNFDAVKAEPPIPQIKTIQEIFLKSNIRAPEPVKLNPAALDVTLEVNNNAPDTNVGSVLMGYLAGQVSDLEGTLQKITDGYNEAFTKALESNDKINRENFIFPNWKPYQPYGKEDYQELKK